MSKTTRNLSMGSACLDSIVERNSILVDKTRHFYNLLKLKTDNQFYFLSRPRRFGRNLLLNMLEDLLKGHRDLFKGLWIDGSDYDFDPNPVINISLYGASARSVNNFEQSMIHSVISEARSEKLKIDDSTLVNAFNSLINGLFNKYDRKVAVLIDEYDAPIKENLSISKLSDDILNATRSFFNCLKDNEAKLGFVLITGVPTFPRASIFSSFDNLVDLTLNKEFATILGFTIEEFDALFPEHLEMALARLKKYGYDPDATIADLREKAIKEYGGYSWDGENRLLNPWAIMGFLSHGSFSDYWTQTAGRPSFLKNLVEYSRVCFKNLNLDEALATPLSENELLNEITPISSLFQAGYLTVSRIDESSGDPKYYLRVPNNEVEQGLWPFLSTLKSIEDTYREPWVLRCNAANMFEGLNEFNAPDFQKYFGEYLKGADDICGDSGEANHSIYNTYFFTAALMAGVDLIGSCETADGTFTHYMTPNGEILIIMITHCPFAKEEKLNFGDKELIKMKRRTEETMGKIEESNYTFHYRGLVKEIHKVAVVVGGHSNVFAIFKKEDFADL